MEPKSLRFVLKKHRCNFYHWTKNEDLHRPHTFYVMNKGVSYGVCEITGEIHENVNRTLYAYFKAIKRNGYVVLL